MNYKLHITNSAIFYLQQSVPPVMAFHLGSLGFLTPFEFENFQEQVTNVLEGYAALTLRSRLRCIIMRKDDDKGHVPSTNLLVLNEVVIDRGPSPYLSNIDLFLDGKHITSVQGDGMFTAIELLNNLVNNKICRIDRVDADWQHGLRSGCWCFDDPPQCACHHGHPYLSSLSVV